MFNYHSIIPWGSFRDRQEEKWGSFWGRDHFGVKIWGSFQGCGSFRGWDHFGGCTGLLKIFGGDVRLVSPNPASVSDQNMKFSFCDHFSELGFT